MTLELIDVGFHLADLFLGFGVLDIVKEGLLVLLSVPMHING